MDNDIVMEGFRLQAELCKSLGEPKRLMIIRELRKGLDQSASWQKA